MMIYLGIDPKWHTSSQEQMGFTPMSISSRESKRPMGTGPNLHSLLKATCDVEGKI